MKRNLTYVVTLLSLMLVFSGAAIAQGQSVEERLDSVEKEVSSLRLQVDDLSTGAVALLFGAFCALWAQNTGRNSWLWFFLGAFFSVITIFVLLWKNSNEYTPRA